MIGRFAPELSRDWRFFRYNDERVVALDPPPTDLQISRALLDTAPSEVLGRYGDRIIFTLENCNAIYRIDQESEVGFGCMLVDARYEHHTLPPR